MALAALFTFACATGARAQSFSATHAKVNVVAEDNSLQPGRKQWVGLLFDLDKGWHIYWVNPGDSGSPPKIQWQLPTGFHASDIQWPTPVRLSTGTLIDYGYEGRVLLPVELQVPASYNAAKPAVLTADVKFLICREVCIPAKTTATLTMPSRTDALGDPASRREIFRNARERTPKPLPASAKAAATDDGKNFVLSVDTGTQETKAAFFPLEEGQIDNSASQTVSSTRRGARIVLKKSPDLTKPISALRGVLVLGSDRAFELAAPIARSH